MPKYIDLLRNSQAGDNKTSGTDSIPESSVLHDENTQQAAPKRTSSKKTTDLDIWLTQCTRITLSFLKAASKRKVVKADKLWLHLKPQLQITADENNQLSTLELKVSDSTKRTREMSEEFGGMLEKSMNMLLLSIKIGRQLKIQDEQLITLVLASMLHHVGLARVPIDIRQKTSALSLDERENIRTALQDGVDYLRECGIDDASVLSAISQSQERIDGSGPLALKATEINFLARIIGLLSFFEALIHYRPYRQRMLPRDAIREIILHHKTAFDHVILKALIDAISLYPIGTYVQLNSGDIGQVIDVHPRLPLRPTVLLRMDRNHQPVTPREVNLQEQTTLLVEQCMYPEDLDLVM